MVLLSYFKCICFLFSGRTSGGIDMIYSTELLSTIQDVLLEGDIVKLRVYEVFIRYIAEILETRLKES